MLLASVLSVVLGVFLSAPISHWLGRNAGYILCLPLLASAVLLSNEFFGSAQRYSTESYPWIPELGVGLDLRLDGLSYVFAMLVLVIGAAVLFYSSRYLGTYKVITFYLLMTTFALAMLILVLANDLMVFYIAWEATTFSSFFLIARSGASARQPAIRTLLVTVAGGLSLLAAICIMIVQAGTTSLEGVLAADFWHEDSGLVVLLSVLLALAAFTKSAQFPFQAWLPDSMVAISPVSAYLHAAAMVKAGIFLLLAFSPVLAGTTWWSVILICGGLYTAIFGATAAMRRHDLKELLAYSTVSQLGYLVALIGVGTEAALTAAVVHTIAHALFKAALFMAIGVIDHEAGTRDMRQLAQRRMAMPVTLTAVVLASASMAGFPPLLGFISKESIFDALLHATDNTVLSVLLLAVAALTAVLTFAYSARLIIGAAGRYRAPLPSGTTAKPASTTPATLAPAHEVSAAFWAVPLIAAGAGLVLGLVPGVLDGIVGPASSVASAGNPDPHLALWHGFNAALVVSLIVIALGLVLVWQRHAVENIVQPRGLKISGLNAVEKTRTSIIKVGGVVGGWTSGQNPGFHLLVPSVGLVAIAAVGVFGINDLPDIYGTPTRGYDWLLVLLVGAGVVAAVRAGTRISAIVVVGVIGFTVTLWFFVLGSVDVALTQLLVEVLTVCVMVLVLKRLPARFTSEKKKHALPAAVIAIATGLAAGLGVWALTGRRGLSEPAEYLLQQGPEITGGDNIVNTILVEFRALDTLGELTVLGVAGLAVAALLSSRDPDPVLASPANQNSPLKDAHDNLVYLRVFSKFIGPLIVLISLVTLFQGHNAPGGGFIAALIAGAGFALIYLSADSDESARIRWPYLTLIGLGVVVGVGTGIVGMAKGSFLTPLHADILGYHFNTALIFDIGVYLAVLGVVLASFNLLGRDKPRRAGAFGPAPPPVPPAHPYTGAMPIIPPAHSTAKDEEPTDQTDNENEVSR